MSVPSSTSSRVSGQCLSWTSFYWLALGVAVLLNTYSDVVLLKPYRYYSSSHYNNYGDDDAPWTTPLSNETIITSATTTTTSATPTDIEGNNNNEKMKTILEILSQRRNAFYQNTTLRAMLQANPECHGKEELLSILYAATAVTTADNNGGSQLSSSSSLQTQAHDVVAQFLQDSCSKLAPWKQVTDLYGTKPIVVGMETCATYRNMLALSNNANKKSSSLSPRVRVAGLYNSGTTALAHALVDNLPRTDASATAAGSDLEEQIRILQQQQGQQKHDTNNNSTRTTNTSIIISPGVPWGKHLPLKYKYINTFPLDNTDDPDLVLPIVVVRDPYRWMQSMCKTAYDAEWTLRPQHCPNLVPTAYELKSLNDSSFFAKATSTTSPNNNNNNKNVKNTYKVNVTYEMAGLHQYGDVYPSLADWWSEWISSYVDSSAPRLLIRFEDLLFHAEYVMAQIIECAHGSISSNTNSSSSSDSISVAATASSQSSSSSLSSLLKPYDYKLTKAKTHGRSTDFVGAILKYARQDTKRSGGMTAQDLAFARGAGDDDDDHDDDKNGGSSNNNNNNKTSNTSSSSSTAPLYPMLMQMFFYTHPPANTPLRIQYRLMNVPS